MKYKVIKTYREAPDNPIKLSKGERISIIEHSDPNGDWPNWVYCKGLDQEGWVPRQIIDIDESTGTITEDYNATEFNLAIGEFIISDKTLNGWVWGVKHANDKEYGWAPLNCLEEIKK